MAKTSSDVDVRHETQAGAGPRRPSVALWMLVGAIWLVALPRVVPGAFNDHGTFISVADRLRAGERLYAEVWDNKDPLFYYGLALARSVSEYGDVLLEVAWLLVAAGAAVSIGRSAGLDGRTAALGGWALAPIVLTGATYVAGMSHLPGAALALATLALALRERWWGVGALLGLLVFLKLLLVPLAGLGALVVVARRGAWASASKVVTAACVAMGAVVAVMAMRGELGAYLDTQVGNFGYSQGELAQSQWGPVVGHLLSMAPEDGRTAALTTLASLAVVVIGASLGQRTVRGRTLLAASATMAVVALGTLAATALWTHHVQILYPAGVVAIVAALAAVPSVALHRRRVWVAGLLIAFLLGGATHPYWYLTASRGLTASLAGLSGVSAEARSLHEEEGTGRYARLGANDTSAHAKGLGAWELGCRRFHQYPFDSREALDEVVECLPTVDAVVIDDSFETEPGGGEWTRFRSRARMVLDQHFTCAPTEYGQLCTRS